MLEHVAEATVHEHAEAGHGALGNALQQGHVGVAGRHGDGYRAQGFNLGRHRGAAKGHNLFALEVGKGRHGPAHRNELANDPIIGIKEFRPFKVLHDFGEFLLKLMHDGGGVFADARRVQGVPGPLVEGELAGRVQQGHFREIRKAGFHGFKAFRYFAHGFRKIGHYLDAAARSFFQIRHHAIQKKLPPGVGGRKRHVEVQLVFRRSDGLSCGKQQRCGKQTQSELFHDPFLHNGWIKSILPFREEHPNTVCRKRSFGPPGRSYSGVGVIPIG